MIMLKDTLVRLRRERGLTQEGRNLVDSYLSYVELGERAARSQGRR